MGSLKHMKEVIIWFLILFATLTGCQIQRNAYISSKKNILVDCVVAIGDKYFDSSRTLVLSFLNIGETKRDNEFVIEFSTNTNRGLSVHFQRHLLERLHLPVRWPIITSCSTGTFKKRNRVEWDTRNADFHYSYVLTALYRAGGRMDMFNDLNMQIQRLESYFAWNSRAKFVVIIFPDEMVDTKHIAKQILEELWRWKIINAIVLISAASNTETPDVLAYTWFPYKPPSGSCGQLKDVVLIDSWITDKGEGRFLQNSDLFSQKVPNDLNGCPIRASTFEFHPFVVCDASLGFGTSRSIVDGLEIRLMYSIAKGMNATLILRIPPGDDRGGIQLKNGTWTGLRADIVYGEADITFASLLSKLEDHLIFDDTINYFTDRFTWFVARAKPYPRWLSMARVFSPVTWLVGLLVLILASMLMRALFCFRIVQRDEVSTSYWRFSICLSSIWAVFLGEGVPSMPRSLPLRTFFLSMVIYSLAVNTIFQTFFTSYVVNPGLLHQISNVDELVTSDLVYAFYYVLDKFFTADFLHKLEPRLQCEPFTCLDHVATKDNYATFCGRALLAYITDELVKQEGKHEIYAFREDSFQLNSVMLMPKGSNLLDRANEVITHIVEAGLPNQFLKSVLDLRRIKAGVVALEDLRDEYCDLNLNQMQGSFFFLLIGLALGLLTVLFENFIYYISCLSK